MNGYEDQAEYDAMVARIDSTPELEQYRDILLYDWQEGAEHWEWASTAPLAEVIDWCEGIRKDEALQTLEDSLKED